MMLRWSQSAPVQHYLNDLGGFSKPGCKQSQISVGQPDPQQPQDFMFWMEKHSGTLVWDSGILLVLTRV